VDNAPNNQQKGAKWG